MAHGGDLFAMGEAAPMNLGFELVMRGYDRRQVGAYVEQAEAEITALAARIPWLADKKPQRGRTTAFLCTGRVCQRPTTDPADFAAQLRAAAAAARRTDAARAPDAAQPEGGAAPR